MTAWLARLKNQKSPDTYATKPTKPTQDAHPGGFVGFVAYPQGHFQKSDACSNDPTLTPPDADPDRWARPHSSAMNGGEIATFNARGAWFAYRGVAAIDAELLADRLVQRDRGDDDRSLCLECRHLRGAGGGWRCGNARAAGWHADLPGELVQTLQRCPGFADAVLPEDAPPFVAPPTPPSAPAPAPPEPSESDPDDWLVLDKVYQAHHFHCRQCIAAGKGYGKRCDTGLALWIDYERAAMAAPTPATKRKPL